MGPRAGYFARRSEGRLAVGVVASDGDAPSLRFVFDISMGVRHGDAALRAELNDFLKRRHADIDAILDEYGIPRLEGL